MPHHAVRTCGAICMGCVPMLCDKCSERCYLCGLDVVSSPTPIHICSTCFHSTYKDRCLACKLKGPRNTARCCRECSLLQKSRGRCPVILQ